MSDHSHDVGEERLARLLALAAPGEWTPPPGLAASLAGQAGSGGGMVALALGDEAMQSASRAVFALALAVVLGTAGLAVLTPAPPAAPPAWMHSDLVRLAAAPGAAGETHETRT
ncbi:MAG: hypothetical protein HYU66_27705 [Armatimonadetes bacterium]|nr:hypothetical protein [Armatimonadota bacterium]